MVIWEIRLNSNTARAMFQVLLQNVEQVVLTPCPISGCQSLNEPSQVNLVFKDTIRLIKLTNFNRILVR